MAQICDGIRVIDFSTGMPGAIATMMLSDNGAEVIKVEPPTGDPDRAAPAFRQWQRGKKSVVLDLGTAEGKQRAKQLAASADVIVENFQAGRAEQQGLGYDELAALNPRLVHCSITGFGKKGPYAAYKDYEGLVQARAGRMMEFQREIDRDGPSFGAVPVAGFAASQLALQGIMAALYVRQRSGRGQKVDTSLLQGLACYDMFNWLSLQLHERFPTVFRQPAIGMGPSLPYLVCVTKDGHWMQMANLPAHLFQAFLKATEMDDIFAAAGFGGTGLMSNVAAAQDLWELLLTRIQDKTMDEWLEIMLADLNISVEPFRSTQEAFDHPQVIANELFVDFDDPEVGKSQQIAPLIRFTETPSAIQGPAPRLGQHTDQVLSALNGARPASANGGNVPPHALDGVTVLELAGFYAAPFGGSLLAELGARVIKIEPLEGDPMRSIMGTTKTTQGKESIALDLKAEEGREIFYKLVEKADILFHNYRPGVPERLGMDYASLKKINPRLIYVYGASYGSSGPYHLRPSFHPSFGAITGGVARQAGMGTPPSSETPLDFEDVKRISMHLARANEGNPDPNSAMVLGSAMAMALFHRERTGQGQYLETSMLGSNLAVNSDDFIRYQGKPPRKEVDENLYGTGALYRLYRASEGWVFLAAPKQDEWEALCAALGRDDLRSDARFASAEAREKNEAALAAVLEPLFAARAADAWERDLSARDVGCVRADGARYCEFLNGDPHVTANAMMVDVVHPAWGPYKRPGVGVNLSLTPGVAGPGNRIGEHTRLLLQELGYSDAEAAHLKEQSTVTWPEEPAYAAN